MNLSKNVSLVGSSVGVVAAATTTSNSHWVDTRGYNGCMFICKASTLAGGSSGFGTWTITAYHAASKSSSVQGSLGTYTSTAVLAGAGTNRLHVFDVYKPTKRYLRCAITGSSVGTYEWIAVLYEPRRPGSTQLSASTTYSGSTCVSGKTT